MDLSAGKNTTESHSESQSSGAIGGGVSLKSGGASLGKEQTDYSLKTVAEQAGIFAGKEGLNVTVKGKTTLAGAIPGAVNEIFSGALKRYEEKYGPISPDQRQWLALVGGVITNYATGQTLQTGGAVAAYGTKHNFEFEELIEKEYKEKKAEIITDANQKVSELKEKGIIKKNADGTLDLGKYGEILFYDYSFGPKLFGKETRLMVDKYGQIYVTVGRYVGGGIGFGSVGCGMLATDERTAMKAEDFISYIEGAGLGISAVSGLGGDISFGRKGPIVALRGGLDASFNISFGYSFYIGRI